MRLSRNLPFLRSFHEQKTKCREYSFNYLKLGQKLSCLIFIIIMLVILSSCLREEKALAEEKTLNCQEQDTLLLAENSLPETIVGIEWEAEGEGERLAEKLLEAGTPNEAKEIICQILYRLGVGVYNHQGLPLVVGNERSEDDFWLYEYQVDILAEAFLRPQYTSLKVLVESWEDYWEAGLTFGPHPDPGALGLFDSMEIETALRDIRLQAEEEPEAREWFLIRLFDALGDREKYPFSLLKEPNDEEKQDIKGLGAAYKDIMQESMASELDKARQEAEESGDTEQLEMLEQMGEEVNMESLMKAAAEGNIFDMLSSFVGEEEAEEMWEMMEEAHQEMEIDDEGLEETPEMLSSISTSRDLIGEMIAMRDGGDLDQLSSGVLNSLKEHRDALAAMLRREEQEMKNSWYQSRINLEDDASIIAAQGISEVEDQLSLIDLEWSLQLSEHTYEIAEARMEDAREWKEEYEELEERFGPYPIELEEEEGSKLMFDPVQIFLLHLDLLPPRPMSDFAQLNNNRKFFWMNNVFIPESVTAGGACEAIGNALEAGGDLFGALNHVFWEGSSHMANKWADIAKGRNIISDALTILSGAIETLGTVITAEVEYNPGDEYIHLRHGRISNDPRHLIVKPKVEYVFDHSDIVQSCGPMAGVNLPEQGPMDNVRVRFYADDLYNYVETRANWSNYIPTYTQNTDEDGVAEGYYYPKWEAPDLGGLLRKEKVDVVLVAMPTPDSSVIYSIASWGVNVGREIFTPIQTSVPVWIQYHEPTSLKGTVEIKRTLLINCDIEVDKPQERGEAKDVRNYRNETWYLNIKFDEAELDKEGNGSGFYKASLNGDWLTDRIWNKAVFCDEHRVARSSPPEGPVNQTLETRTWSKGEGEGAVFSSANMWLDVHNRRDAYRLQVEPILLTVASEMSAGRFSGFTDITIEEKDCEKRETRDVGSPGVGFEKVPSMLFQPIKIPVNEWENFDRDASRLSGSLYYPITKTSRDGKVSYEMTTEIWWTLDRVDD